VADERDDAQRTEEPTGRRLDDARQKGDVVKSPELSSFVMLASGTLALAGFAGMAARNFTRHFEVFLERPNEIPVDPGGMMRLFHQVGYDFLLLIAPSMGLFVIAGLSGNLVQHGLLFSVERIKPTLSKLSLIAGFKRLFGLDGLINLVKGIAKITLLGAAGVAAVWPERARLATALDLGPAGIAALSLAAVIKALIAMLVVYALIAAADYFYQRQRFMARHRMSRQELRDEMKQSDGDPQVKARIRQVRLDRARTRMIAAVPDATVVITNPTHYAVALKYESGKMGAPVCVAKGVDHMAQNIRKVAKEHGVPIVENPPLARALYAAVELDQEVPAEHYKAVAGIVGYVMRLAKKNKFWRN